jgi:thioredoxin reductase
LYANEPRPPVNALLAVRRGGRLLVVAAERVIVANGGASQPLPFPGVDRPGVYAARGLLSLFARSKVRVGEKLAVLGDGKELVDCARALRLAGYELASVVALNAAPEAPDLEVQVAQPVRALGNPVRAIEIAPQTSGLGPRASGLGPEASGVIPRARIRCDAVAIALSPAPLHGLASSVGATARWVSALHGFPLEIDAEGRTAVPWLFAAGRVAGLGGAAAVASGEAAGKAACP